jgi:hypothetical protein
MAFMRSPVRSRSGPPSSHLLGSTGVAADGRIIPTWNVARGGLRSLFSTLDPGSNGLRTGVVEFDAFTIALANRDRVRCAFCGWAWTTDFAAIKNHFPTPSATIRQTLPRKSHFPARPTGFWTGNTSNTPGDVCSTT